MKMTVNEIVNACGGKLLCGDGDTIITSVCTDSRKVEAGTLFVPMKGERTDAHLYIESVFEHGAAASLTQEHNEYQSSHCMIRVEDTVEALQKIAFAYRSMFSLPVVGITGSVGKTTTKEMVALAVSSGLNTMKTEGNFNSQVGLPLTIFQLLPEHETAIIEMGMSDFGEMSRLAQIAVPKRAIITNIGISHIEQLKDQQNIRTEKLHITDCFDHDSLLFLNGDDLLLAELRGTLPYKCVYFGTKSWCDYRAEEMMIESDATIFQLNSNREKCRVRVSAPGIHNVYNALAAIAVADSLGVMRSKSIPALELYTPPAMRQQVHRSHKITILDDTYNASPDSMKSSIDVLCALSKNGRKICVLADMLELGEHSNQAHFEVGAYAAKAGISILIAVGKEANHLLDGVDSVGCEMVCRTCLDNAEAIKQLNGFLKPGDAVLVKGSRGMHMDEIVKTLLEEHQ